MIGTIDTQEYSRMDSQDNSRIWQWMVLGLIVWVGVATAYMIAIVGGAL